MLKQSPENLVLQAVMDEFEENREKGNLTAELLNREKVRNSHVIYVLRKIVKLRLKFFWRIAVSV